MRNQKPVNRHSGMAGGSVWVLAVLAVLVVVGLVVWMMSDPTNRTASAPEQSTTAQAPKSPPASSPSDPATQSSSR